MTVFLIYTFREPDLLRRTVAALAPHPVVVHVAAKVDETPFRDALAEATNPVTFIAARERVNWGGFRQLTAIRKMVAAGLEIAAPDEYLVLLSGQDYPIRPVAELDELFATSGGKQFMRYFQIAGTEEKYTRQIDHRAFRDLGLLSTRTGVPVLRSARNVVIRSLERVARLFPKLTPPAGMRVAHGPTHFALTASFLRDLEASVTPEIESYFRKIFVPEEKFYQSLSGASPRGRETGGSLPGGFEPYVGPGNYRYSNLHHIDPSLVKVYTDDDWPEVVASKQFFLRKLEAGRSAALLDRIDARLRE